MDLFFMVHPWSLLVVKFMLISIYTIQLFHFLTHFFAPFLHTTNLHGTKLKKKTFLLGVMLETTTKLIPQFTVFGNKFIDSQQLL